MLSNKVEDTCRDVFLSLWQRRDLLQINNLEASLTQAAKYAVINVIKSNAGDEKHLTNSAHTLTAAIPAGKGTKRVIPVTSKNFRCSCPDFTSPQKFDFNYMKNALTDRLRITPEAVRSKKCD